MDVRRLQQKEEDDDDDALMLEENGCAVDGEAAVVVREQPESGAAFAGDYRLELSMPPTLPPSEPPRPTVSATDPVDGALIAGINGSKALVRHACIAQLLQLGQIDETDKSDSRAAGARTCSRLEHPRPYAA